MFLLLYGVATSKYRTASMPYPGADLGIFPQHETDIQRSPRRVCDSKSYCPTVSLQ
jgi:hypothetical protein